MTKLKTLIDKTYVEKVIIEKYHKLVGIKGLLIEKWLLKLTQVIPMASA